MMTRELEIALIDALRLPDYTTSLQINIGVGKPMTVQCEYIPNVRSEPIERAIKLFRLARFDEENLADITVDKEIENAKARLHKKIDLKCEIAHLNIHRQTTLVLHEIWGRHV